jgi:hypothetical protein
MLGRLARHVRLAAGSIPVGDRAANARKSLTVRGRVMVSHIFASWNQLEGWLRQVEVLRRAA